MKALARLAVLGAAGLALLAPPRLLGSASAAALYNHGNELYRSGDFEGARRAYEQAQATGVRNPELDYNLGNAELKAGRLGPAIASFLRAERLAPRDPDVLFNLAYARGKIQARLPDLPRGRVRRAFEAAVNLMAANEWTLISLAAYWLAGAGLVGLILARSAFPSRASRRLFQVGLALFFLTLPFTTVRVKRDVFTSRAVIVDEKASARSGPGDNNAALFELVEGMDVEVGQCQSGWCRVSAAGGFIGWVGAESFERL